MDENYYGPQWQPPDESKLPDESKPKAILGLTIANMLVLLILLLLAIFLLKKIF